MKIFYIILAHDRPGQFERLVHTLSGSDNWLYIHIDRSTSTAPFREATAGMERVRFLDDTERVRIRWAHISQVEAVLAVLRKIRAEHPNETEGYVIQLSGQDYPIRSQAYIRNFLSAHATTTYMQTEKIPYANLTEGGLDRIRDTCFHLGGRLVQRIRRFRFDKTNAVTFYKIVRYRPSQLFRAIHAFFVRRKYPFPDLPPYVGEYWCGFPLQVGDLLLDETESRPDFMAFHRHTQSPDECLFHTLTANNRDRLPGPLRNRCLHYIDWSNRHTPVVFTNTHRDDLQRIIDTDPESLFARKFDDSTAEGREILDFIDQHIQKS